MTPKLPRSLSGGDVRRALTKAGFKEVSQRGSHLKMKHPDGRVVIIPMHSTIALGTLRSILRQARLTLGELLDLLK